VRASPARFVALARRLGATADSSLVASELLTRWAEPVRTYHSLRHLDDCLQQLDAAPTDGADSDLAEAALWYHDAVYDPRRGDNEVRSADLAREQLTTLGVVPDRVARVASLVLLTRHHERPEDAAGRLVCDIDLSILGRPAEEFERYDREIRAEYRWVPEAHYRHERAAVLRGFLGRNPLYLTPYFRDRYEQPARTNLLGAIARLENRDTEG
jgi:predicted metal-dependent HD superfamily phosphohydrolase